MKMIDSRKPRDSFRLDWNEQWIFNVADSLTKRADCNTYRHFLAKEMLCNHNKTQGERLWAARLLGALGARTEISYLIYTMNNDPSRWVRQAASESLVEIGQIAGERIISGLENMPDDTKIDSLKALRKIMESPRTTTPFRWLCYCVAYDLFYNDFCSNNKEKLSVHAAPIIGYFDFKGRDLTPIDAIIENVALRQTIKMTVISSPPPRVERPLSGNEQGDRIQELIEYFCLTDSTLLLELQNIIRHKDQSLSDRGFYALIQGLACLYRSQLPDIDKNTLDALWSVVYANESPELANQISPEHQEEYVALLERVLLQKKKLFCIASHTLEEWREWALAMWQQAKENKSKFVPASNPSSTPKIAFRRVN